MKCLALVVCVDTAAGHMAGALGVVPVWLALSVVSDWRWLRRREETPWYPSMRLFRQRKLGEWDEVFTTMARELQRLTCSAMVKLQEIGRPPEATHLVKYVTGR